jgi:hypothetical protein
VELEVIRGAYIVLIQEGYVEESLTRKIKIMALVDSRSYMLAINENPETTGFKES